ncbi:MAG: chaperone modulator CbpM [Oceanicoccus sp.]
MNDVLLKISLQELCQCEGLTEPLIVEVVSHGIAEPAEGHTVADWVFDTSSVRWLQKAVRLYYDLDIDWVAVAMVIDLLQQKEALEERNRYIERQLNRLLE